MSLARGASSSPDSRGMKSFPNVEPGEDRAVPPAFTTCAPRPRMSPRGISRTPPLAQEDLPDPRAGRDVGHRANTVAQDKRVHLAPGQPCQGLRRGNDRERVLPEDSV